MFFENRPVYEIIWKKKNMIQPDRQATRDNITRRMRIAYTITKATETRSEYVILVALPRQQWLRERSSMLRYKHIACLVHIYHFMLVSTAVTYLHLKQK